MGLSLEERVANLEVMAFGASLDDMSGARFQIGDTVKFYSGEEEGTIVGIAKEYQGRYLYKINQPKGRQGNTMWEVGPEKGIDEKDVEKA